MSTFESILYHALTAEMEEPVTFFRYPKEGEYLLSLRDRILLAVEEKLK